jgi:hypothetical protein
MAWGKNLLAFHKTVSQSWGRSFCFSVEPLAELNKTVVPVTSVIQMTLKNLDSGLRRNDVAGLLQEAPWIMV